MRSSLLSLSMMVVGMVACSDSPLPTELRDALSSANQVKFWENGAAAHWNEVARAQVAANSSGAPFAIRGYAIVSLAQYNAAIAAEKAGRGVPPADVPDRAASVRAAVAAASVVALSYLYPPQAPALESKLQEFLDEPPLPRDKKDDAAEGEAIGRAVAAQVVERAKSDASFAPWSGTLLTGPGVWFSNGAPVGVLFGRAKTYFLSSGNQFRPPPPPAFGSPAFVAALAEVRQISNTRTPAQDASAKFWNLPAGTYQPPGYWNEEAVRLAIKYRLSERDATHLLALMNMVSFDAIVASHEAKYTYMLIRPSQADPGIVLSIGLPNFPSYPSNHAAISAGMAAVLGARFPAEATRLAGLADEAALSRVLGGIHYRFDGEAGLTLGRKVAAWALAHDVKRHEPFPLQ